MSVFEFDPERAELRAKFSPFTGEIEPESTVEELVRSTPPANKPEDRRGHHEFLGLRVPKELAGWIEDLFEEAERRRPGMFRNKSAVARTALIIGLKALSAALPLEDYKPRKFLAEGLRRIKKIDLGRADAELLAKEVEKYHSLYPDDVRKMVKGQVEYYLELEEEGEEEEKKRAKAFFDEALKHPILKSIIEELRG